MFSFLGEMFPNESRQQRNNLFEVAISSVFILYEENTKLAPQKCK